MSQRLDRSQRERRLILCALAVLVPGIWWGLPGSESWAPDSITPRSVGLLAIAESYRWGHHHTYPPLHMLLLTVLTSPVHLWTLLRVGTDEHAFVLMQEGTGPMTAIETVARVVAVAMGVLTIRNIARVFGGGWLPGICALLYAPFAYYGKVGNLDVPALFWASSALLAAHTRNVNRFTLFATCAALTKDQSVGLLLLPAVWLAWHERRRPKQLVRNLCLAGLAYGVVSGALVNPIGVSDRVRELLGPASQTWANHSADMRGRIELVIASILEMARSSSPIIVLLAGIGLYWSRKRPIPALAALSFFLTFALGARRSEARFVMPLGMMLLPYASIPLVKWRTRNRSIGLAVTAIAVVSATWPVLCLNATLVRDARYQVEDYLGALPPGTTVAYIGGPKFAPRLPRPATRPGVEPLGTRDALANLTEVLQPSLAPDSDVLVVSTEFGDEDDVNPHFGVSAYTDPSSITFFRALRTGQTSYAPSLVAHCNVPWPLRCFPIHGSAGGTLRVFKKR